MSGKDTLLIGDQAIYKFKVSVPKGSNFFLENIGAKTAGNVEFIGMPKVDTIASDGGGINLETSFTVTSFDSGSHTIPIVRGFIEDPEGKIDTVLFDAGTLEVTTIPIDTTTYKPYDVKGQMKAPYTVSEFLPWLALLVAITALTLILIRVWKRYREGRLSFKRGEPESQYMIALKELERINREKLWQNNQTKLFYTRITDVLRIYIEANLNLPAMERTSAQILDDLLGYGIEKQEYESLKSLLEVADLVKFAKYIASETENQNAIPRAIRFVSATAIKEEE